MVSSIPPINVRPPPPSSKPYRLQRRPEERVSVLGASMDLMRHEEVMWFVSQAVDKGERAIVANHNLHSLYLARRNAPVQAFFRRADIIEIDSMPLIYWARLLGFPSRSFHRCTYLDWRDYFWALAAERGWRVFYLGGAPGVAQAAAQQIGKRHPEVTLAVRHGYFDATPGSADSEAVAKAIAEFAPNILFVGMGMPRQEAWIEANSEALPPCVMFSVGAAFDYEAGVQRPAPRWMGRAGVEWLFRLMLNPARMARRYCIEPLFLLPAALADLKQARRRKSARETASTRTGP